MQGECGGTYGDVPVVQSEVAHVRAQARSRGHQREATINPQEVREPAGRESLVNRSIGEPAAGAQHNFEDSALP